MTSLANHQSNDYVKLLLTGDSGSGKSGALASLVAAGYTLRILDFDNGLDSLKSFAVKDAPDKLDNVEFRTLRDNYKIVNGVVTADRPQTFANAMKMLNHWQYQEADGTTVDLGVPASWGGDTIVAIDSLSFLADAAFNLVKSLNPGTKDPRQWYNSAQELVRAFLGLLTSGSFGVNVIVIAHIRYSTQDDGRTKGYPNAIGGALGPRIPTFFNQWMQMENKGGKRSLYTMANTLLDLKNTKPFEILPSYDIKTGLADCFAHLHKIPARPTKPTEKVIPFSTVKPTENPVA